VSRVPVSFLAGYLGAGKTTALNRILATTTEALVVIEVPELCEGSD
jgi:G3E family GTPase